MFKPYAQAEGYLPQGYGFEFSPEADGGFRYHEKEGGNVGVSALLRHYPRPGVTLVMLGVGEDTIWPLVKLFDQSM